MCEAQRVIYLLAAAHILYFKSKLHRHVVLIYGRLYIPQKEMVPVQFLIFHYILQPVTVMTVWMPGISAFHL